MAKGFSPIKIIGLVILAAGVIVLIIGIYQFVEFRNSIGGGAAKLGNSISKAFGGSTKLAKGYQQPLILIISGVVAAALGGFITVKK
jgi:hypothetical protein